MEIEQQLEKAARRFDELNERLQDPAVLGNANRLAEVMREYKQLEPIVSCYRERQDADMQLHDLYAMLQTEQDPDMRRMVTEEMQALQASVEQANGTMESLLQPMDAQDDRSVIVEIRSGAGGEESALFAYSLYRMYSMYAERHGWVQQVMSCNETELGGIKEIVFSLSGTRAYGKMKYESGVHRVQRVPETESQGRVHTSTVTVAVLQEVEEVAVTIQPTDLRIDVFRSSGAGGQHINKTESAVRITHLPTGLVVECQDERSQHKNKDRAMSILRARLYDRMQAEQNAQISSDRRAQVGTGDRSEKIRTYNFPQSRMTDHRIGFSLYRLDDVMNGDLDALFDALAAAEQAAQLAGEAEGQT